MRRSDGSEATPKVLESDLWRSRSNRRPGKRSNDKGGYVGAAAKAGERPAAGCITQQEANKVIETPVTQKPSAPEPKRTTGEFVDNQSNKSTNKTVEEARKQSGESTTQGK